MADVGGCVAVRCVGHLGGVVGGSRLFGGGWVLWDAELVCGIGLN